MDPRKTPKRLEDLPDAPALEEQDWEANESGAIRPDSIPENGDLRYDEEHAAESLEEEDDNVYQNSDEALPDDREEAALTHNRARRAAVSTRSS